MGMHGKRNLLTFDSHVLQQPPDDPDLAGCFIRHGRLVCNESGQELPSCFKKRNHWRHDFHRPVLDLHFLHVGMVRPSDFFDNVLHGGCAEQIADCHIWSGLLRCTRHAP